MRTPREIADELRVLACQDGDARAFERLVARWQKPLWRHARRVTGRDDLAWDALQEAWIAIVRGLHRLHDTARFEAWAHRIVRRKSADLVRGDRRRRETIAEAGRRAGPGAAEDTDVTSVADGLVRALRALAPKHREVLALFYRDGFGIAEIAALLHIPAGTVKSRLHHARQQIKERLK